MKTLRDVAKPVLASNIVHLTVDNFRAWYDNCRKRIEELCVSSISSATQNEKQEMLELFLNFQAFIVEFLHCYRDTREVEDRYQPWMRSASWLLADCIDHPAYLWAVNDGETMDCTGKPFLHEERIIKTLQDLREQYGKEAKIVDMSSLEDGTQKAPEYKRRFCDVKKAAGSGSGVANYWLCYEKEYTENGVAALIEKYKNIQQRH